jgi:predicted dinucleotide-binding enzyme
MTRIGVLGGGNVGGGLAELWRQAGHDVRVSGRDTIAETAAFGDVVVLAVPDTAASEALSSAGSLAGKVLIDATNNLGGGPTGAEIAALVPDAEVVKAFNTVFARLYDRLGSETPAPSMVLCGDDEEAKTTVALLARDAGYEPVDAGGIDAAADIEAFARLVIGIAYRQGHGPFFYHFDVA